MENHIKYSKGVCWIGDCRIPFVNESDIKSATPGSLNATGEFSLFHIKNDRAFINQQGRFTPNLLVCDDVLNDGVITQYNKTREDKGNYLGGHRKEYVGTTDNDVVKQIKGQFFSDKGSNSRYYDLDKWFDKVIDEIQ